MPQNIQKNSAGKYVKSNATYPEMSRVWDSHFQLISHQRRHFRKVKKIPEDNFPFKKEAAKGYFGYLFLVN